MYGQCLEKLPDNRFWELEIDSFHFPVNTSCRNADADIIFLFLFFSNVPTNKNDETRKCNILFFTTGIKHGRAECSNTSHAKRLVSDANVMFRIERSYKNDKVFLFPQQHQRSNVRQR